MIAGLQTAGRPDDVDGNLALLDEAAAAEAAAHGDALVYGTVDRRSCRGTDGQPLPDRPQAGSRPHPLIRAVPDVEAGRPEQAAPHGLDKDGVMDWIDALAAWAWNRHHNVLSWYIRPLFLLPFCWFAHRRSPLGLAATWSRWRPAWPGSPHRPRPTRPSSRC
jgi:hypothetical protein